MSCKPLDRRFRSDKSTFDEGIADITTPLPAFSCDETGRRNQQGEAWPSGPVSWIFMSTAIGPPLGLCVQPITKAQTSHQGGTLSFFSPTTTTTTPLPLKQHVAHYFFFQFLCLVWQKATFIMRKKRFCNADFFFLHFPPHKKTLQGLLKSILKIKKNISNHWYKFHG